MELAIRILEAIMIISFGVSWPINLYKSFKTKSTKGKSPYFLGFIIFGYVAGIIGKILSSQTKENFWAESWWVFMFYVLNLLMVTLDLSYILYI